MVKVGFICEGQTEQILFLSANFKNLLASKDIEIVNVIDAVGSGNLLPHNINKYIRILENSGAEKIFIITDLDADACITVTKQRISARPTDIVIVAVRQIEAWFLAATKTMRFLLKNEAFFLEFPENEISPFIKINQLLVNHLGRGIGNKSAAKIKLVNALISKGFNVAESAEHPNCPSAAYFARKLNELNG